MKYPTKPSIEEVQAYTKAHNIYEVESWNTHDYHRVKEDTIEEFWIPLWIYHDLVPLNKDQSRLLITLLGSPMSSLAGMVKDISESKDPGIKFQYGLVWQSMGKRFDIELDLRSKIWIFFQCYRPGILVMIYAYIKYMMHQLSLTTIEFEDLNTRIFPNGFPSETFFEWLWDCQKLPDGTNLLDHGEAYRSFIETVSD